MTNLKVLSRTAERREPGAPGDSFPRPTPRCASRRTGHPAGKRDRQG